MKNYYKMMQRASAVKVFRCLFAFVIAVLILFLNNRDFIDGLNATEEITGVRGKDIQPGEYYRADTNYLIDSYATDDEGVYYIAAVTGSFDEHVEYMGFYLKNEDTYMADSIVAQFWMDSDNLPNDWLNGFGYVYEMSQTERDYFKEYFLDAGLEYEATHYLCYKTLVFTDTTSITSSLLSDKANLVAIVLFIYALAAAIVIFVHSTKYAKDAVKTFDLDTDAVANDLDLYGEKIGCMTLGRNYAAINGEKGMLIPLDKCIWAFQKTVLVQRRLYGIIPLGKTKALELHFVMRNGDVYFTTLKKGCSAEEMLVAIKKVAPNVIVGYSEELFVMMHNNFNQLVTLSDKGRTMM